MLTALLIVLVPVLAIGYLCLAVKIGFMVSEATEHTGFDAGFYMITVIGLTTLPLAAAYLLGGAA